MQGGQNEKKPTLRELKELLQDNARVHTSNSSRTVIEELKFESDGYPPYSPDLALSDYFFFKDLKKNFGFYFN